MYTFQALQILIFLIPGFVSATILNILIYRKEKKEFEKIIESLIFSMFIYTAYAFIYSKSPVIMDQIEGTIIYSYDNISLLVLGLLSIVIPVVLGFLITGDYHMKLARRLYISKRTARESIWLDVFWDIDEYIIINFENGRRIFGWPMYFSQSPDKPYIFLTKPAWIVEDEEKRESKYIQLEVEGILITPEQKIETIEFLKG
jgi:hypothetical protein